MECTTKKVKKTSERKNKREVVRETERENM